MSLKVTFMDINKTNLERVTHLCQRELDSNGVNIKIHTTTDRVESLKGACFIFNMIRVGGVEAFNTDIEIPLKCGVDQCVGDTLCVDGIMYGQRTIPAMLDQCRDIREHCKEDALLLNYSSKQRTISHLAIDGTELISGAKLSSESELALEA